MTCSSPSSTRPSGGHRWSKAYGDASPFQYAGGVAVDQAGGVWAVGLFFGTLPIGLAPFFASDDGDAFAVKLDDSGNLERYRHWGDGTVLQQADDVAVDGDDNAYVAGSFAPSTSATGPRPDRPRR